MGLKSFGVYVLGETRPLEDYRSCWVCQHGLPAGAFGTMVPVELFKERKRTELVCANCALRGRQVETPEGPRVILRVGESSEEFPVEMTDGSQWREEEISAAEEVT